MSWPPRGQEEGTELSLAKFANYSMLKVNQTRRLALDDLMNLPTGPRKQTSYEIEISRIEGGFRSYKMGSILERRDTIFSFLSFSLCRSYLLISLFGFSFHMHLAEAGFIHCQYGRQVHDSSY
uniref:Uncharacterized protein n=1 Tax=Kalanchoe fedtschenkoi TaxID=63787 RepID=A0A7N0ZUY6_KALFE